MPDFTNSCQAHSAGGAFLLCHNLNSSLTSLFNKVNHFFVSKELLQFNVEQPLFISQAGSVARLQ